MTKLTIIGDVHGKVEQYKEITDNCEVSICVGDFGFEKQWNWLYENIDSDRHVINPGNHDTNKGFTSQYSTGHFSFQSIPNLFTVRGAESIDKHLRTEGIDWFADEELNYQQQLEAFDLYAKVKPRIVISHDCPQIIMESIFKMGWSFGKSQTRNMLQAMFDAHKPELWVFGHHHFSKDVNIFGTRFVCLDELETLTIEV